MQCMFSRSATGDSQIPRNGQDGVHSPDQHNDLPWLPRDDDHLGFITGRANGSARTIPSFLPSNTGHALRHWEHVQPIWTRRAEVRRTHLSKKKGEDRPVYGIQHGRRSGQHQEGDVMGHCSLIYQDSTEDYLNEMGHMSREAAADNVEWREWRDLRWNTRRKPPTKDSPDGAGPLSEDWVRDAFDLSTNETLKDKPELMSQLVKVLSNHGPAFEGRPHRQKEAGQTESGRTHWVTARDELREDCMEPLYVKQCRMHPHDKAMLSSQLNLWI